MFIRYYFAVIGPSNGESPIVGIGAKAGDVFSGGADRARSDHGSEIKELHAKIGELTVVNDFLARGLKR